MKENNNIKTMASKPMLPVVKSNIYPYKNLDLQDMEGEEWNSCFGYDGYYEVSNLGRVKSVFRIIVRKDGREMKIQERILRQAINKKQKTCKYLFVGFTKEGVKFTEEVHRLVGIAFLPSGNKKYIIHKNHNTLDNRVENLKWASGEEKAQQAWDIGYQVSVNIGKFGGESSSAKKIVMLDMNGNKKMDFTSRIEAANWLIKNGFAPKQRIENVISAINRASIGKTKFSYGHKWKP